MDRLQLVNLPKPVPSYQTNSIRLAFIEDYTLKSLRLKTEKWNKLVISDDQRGFLHSFVDQGTVCSRTFFDLIKFPHEGFVSLLLLVFVSYKVRGVLALSASTLNNLQHASHKGNKYFAPSNNY